MYNQIILTGILVSLLYTEITGFSAGLIIPGYLALNLHNPVRLLYTLAVAAAAAALCRLLSRFLILYGRRRFAMVILLTFALESILTFSGLIHLNAIGLLLPGLIARELDRQGFAASLLGMTITTGITVLISVLLGVPLIF